MIVSEGTFFIGGVAVTTLHAVHIFGIPAALAETAAVAQSAHTVRAEPAVAAKVILSDIIAIVTAKTVPTVIHIAILAAKTFAAIVRQLVTGTAFAAVGG